MSLVLINQSCNIVLVVDVLTCLIERKLLKKLVLSGSQLDAFCGQELMHNILFNVAFALWVQDPESGK
jgi:hypothetical protein